MIDLDMRRAGVTLRHWLPPAAQRALQRHPRLLPMLGMVLLVGVARLLPAAAWADSDGWLGRPGDSALCLSLLLLAASHFLGSRVAAGAPDSATEEVAADAILGVHLRLDQEIDHKLDEVVGATEHSALAIMVQVRGLHDKARKVVDYLDSSSLKAAELGEQIVASVATLREIGDFIALMPASIERDMRQTQSVIHEITALSDLVRMVQAVSMQSHILALNAAIEASRAGPSGVAFRVVADEVRALASNSGSAAAQIQEGLARARQCVECGMKAGLNESAQRLARVVHTATSIERLREHFEDAGQYYKTRFAVVTKHNVDLVGDIAEVLGHIQYQDVVRQYIERMQAAMRQRNALFQDTLSAPTRRAGLEQLPGALTVILDDYQHEEDKHVHSAALSADDDSHAPKIELF